MEHNSGPSTCETPLNRGTYILRQKLEALV
ncbi:hypothetical protein B0G69_0232 [Paraburkholderia sp. RAU2J]|nr:hypothetical protein B0G69_0232 [Paraburkholderia sp. RAU2J]